MKISKVTAVDLFKLLFAICIVALHTNSAFLKFDDSMYYIKNLFFRLGVPFFFVSSGFFFGNKLIKNNNDKDRISVAVKYTKKNLPKMLFWSIISGLIIAYLGIMVKKHAIFLEILRFFQCLIFYPRGAMWFVWACIISALFIAKFWERKIILITLGIFGYIFALLCNTYFFAVSNTNIAEFVKFYMQYFVSARNGLFIGITYFGLGIWLSSPNNFMKKLKTSYLWFIFIIQFSILFFEVFNVRYKQHIDDASLYIIMPFLSITILEMALRLKMPYSLSCSLYMRQLSGYLYYIHPLCGFLLNPFLKCFDGYEILIFVTKLLICYFIFLFVHKSNNRFVKTILP